jgi:hypothetical protein
LQVEVVATADLNLGAFKMLDLKFALDLLSVWKCRSVGIAAWDNNKNSKAD